jgi:hypothetical protein
MNKNLQEESKLAKQKVDMWIQITETIGLAATGVLPQPDTTLMAEMRVEMMAVNPSIWGDRGRESTRWQSGNVHWPGIGEMGTDWKK